MGDENETDGNRLAPEQDDEPDPDDDEGTPAREEDEDPLTPELQVGELPAY